MWLFTTEGAYSAIRWHDGRICVRGRRKADLDRLRKIVPALSKVEVSPGKDYRYRCFCSIDEWADGMAVLARKITYGNFKSEVARRRGIRDPYEKTLHSVWSLLARLQPAGPYGYDTRAGYPPVPKSEKKAVREARAARPALADWPVPRWPQSSLPGTATDDCADCGAELGVNDGIIVDGEIVCRDVAGCVDRMRVS